LIGGGKMRKYVINNDIIKEEIHVCDYDNGLKAYVLPKQGYTKKYATYAAHYGSIDSEYVVPGESETTKVPDGIAHFLEHKLFEQEDGPVMERFSALGASSNAYTSFDHTAYLFSCTEKFEDSFKLLLKFVQNPYLTDENVEKEKGIIGQEIRMYEDDPNWRVLFNFLGALYKNHPVKKDIAGTIESISKINKENLYKCYNTFYHPSNMIICVVGDVDPQWVFNTIKENQKITKDMPEIKRIYSDEVGIHKEYIEQCMEVATPLFAMGFKEDTKNIVKQPALHNVGMKILLEMILGRGSDLYKQLYENGLITSNFDADYTYEGGYSYSLISGESKKPDEVKNIISQAIQKYKSQGLDQNDFDRVRKMSLGNFIKLFNSVEGLAHQFVADNFKGIGLFDLLEAYNSINIMFINDILDKHFRLENMALSVVKPK
jgi:predicted Zn-dependent peptidase